ncbi:MAG: anthranilate synthase component I family protein, partial [Acidobacteriota bacterium]
GSPTRGEGSSVGLEGGRPMALPDRRGTAERSFPWQPGSRTVLNAIAGFVGKTGGRRIEVDGRVLPLGGGVTAGWIGHELDASALAHFDTLLYLDLDGDGLGAAGVSPAPGESACSRAMIIAAHRRGRASGGPDEEARDRAERWAGRLAEAQAHGRALLETGSRFSALRAGGAGLFPPVRHDPAPAWSRLSRPAYEGLIGSIKEAIGAGEVYQVNLSQPLHIRLRNAAPTQLARLFVSLWAANPVPYPAFISLGGTTVISLSPERYLARRGAWMESCPIKGTRPRGETADKDRSLARQLLQSAKDRAENIMIVDLVRNDLGRIAQTGSVRVEEICRLRSFASVHHLVSTVAARLRPGVGVDDVLAALHPAGSMTGAPKIPAVQILKELEGRPRGPYAGGIGWFAGPSVFHLAMIIRSLVAGAEEAILQVGGGIVADSDPGEEYQETLDKARSLAAVLNGSDPSGWAQR